MEISDTEKAPTPGTPPGYRPIFEEKPGPGLKYEESLAWVLAAGIIGFIAFELVTTYL